jgi:hypothetical protein
MKNLFSNNILDDNSIKVEIIKKPKTKGSIKIKINGLIYHLIEGEEEYVVFTYSTGQKEVIASIFNKYMCKDASYMELERLYTDKLVEFNQGWNHDNYTTVRILDKVYKLLNK